MKRGSALVSFTVGSFTPALAMACPAAKWACTSSCSANMAEYASAVGFGLLAGLGSVALEAWVKSRRQ